MRTKIRIGQSSWCSQILHVNVKSFSFKNLKIFNFHFIQSFQSLVASSPPKLHIPNISDLKLPTGPRWKGYTSILL